MSRSLPIAATAIGVLTLVCIAVAGDRPVDRAPTSDQAMSELRDGNRRYVAGRARHPHADPARRRETFIRGQHPMAIVVACADSRVPVEIIFDVGVGDMFVIRVAGNVCATDETGSIEYAIEHLGTPLIVVLGHRDCGAVTAVVKGARELGSVPALVSHIQPAVDHVRRTQPTLSGDELIAAAVRQNVWHSIEDLFEHSDAARARAADGRLRVVGAIYDIHSGMIDWLGEHPRQSELIRPARTGVTTRPASTLPH
jgi:carbonic anhydrase